jgi:hypothetical protein
LIGAPYSLPRLKLGPDFIAEIGLASFCQNRASALFAFATLLARAVGERSCSQYQKPEAAIEIIGLLGWPLLPLVTRS